MNPEFVRIDKWLWAVRLFKTRSLATAACKAGHVKINGFAVKPGREVRVGELITVQLEAITRTLRVVGILEKRVGAALVPQSAEELTPPEEFERQRLANQAPTMLYPKGLGRPTKKARRALMHFDPGAGDVG